MTENHPQAEAHAGAGRRRRADSKLALMQERTAAYLQQHEEAPDRWPLRMEDIAAYVPCAVRLFYKDEPESRALLAKIDAARARQAEAVDRPQADGTGGGLAGLPDAVLSRRVRQLLVQARWTMQRYLGQHPEREPVEDAPLAKYDLDAVVEHLRRAQPELQGLIAEQQRRRRVVAVPPAGGTGAPMPASAAGPDLFSDDG